MPINAIFLWKTTHRHTSYHDMRPHKFINRSREDFSLKRRAYRVKRCSFAEFQKMKMSPSLWRPHQTATHPGCWRPLPRRCKARKSSRRPWAWWRGSAAHFPPIFPCNKYHSTRSARIVDFCALLMLMIMDKIGSQMCTQKYNCDNYFLPSSLRSIEEHARGIGLTADRRAGQLVSFHDGRMIDSKGARVIWRFVDSLVLNRPSTAHDRMPVNRFRE